MTSGPDSPGGGFPSGSPDSQQQAAALRPWFDAIVVALLDCTPEYWTGVRLRVQRETHPGGQQVTSVFVESPEGYAEPVVVGQALRDAVDQLWANSLQQGLGFRRLTLEASAGDGKDWDYKIDLKYGG